MTAPRTLYDKIWDDHLVVEQDDGTCLLYIDRHLVHEVTSPQAFEGLRTAGPQGRAPEKTLAVVDHNVPTTDRALGIDERGKPHPGRGAGKERRRFRRRVLQRERQAPGHRPHHRAGTGLHPARHHHRLRRQPHLDAWRVRRAGARHRHLGGRACSGHPDADPEKSQEHAGQVDGELPDGVTAKDIILAIIGEIGTAGGTGHVIEFAGEAIRALSMEGRMTVCNMTIEGGARAG
jgi:3-isopropylmalate/(R)-2-methylmalate dehydratase large subunit